MAISSDFVPSTAGDYSLTAGVVEALRQAVIVVDTRSRRLPVVLANATARRCVNGDADSALVDTSLRTLLGGAAGPAMSAATDGALRGQSDLHRVLPWQLHTGETPLDTELKTLASGRTPRLVMLTFAEPQADTELHYGLAHTPFDLTILNGDLSVTYANAGAVRAAGAMVGGILNYSALTLVPTSALPRQVFEDVLRGRPHHVDALQVPAAGGGSRWFELDLQPLESPSGDVGIAVLSTEFTARRAHEQHAGYDSRRLLALTAPNCDSVSVAGRDGRLHYLNAGVRRELGYAADEACAESSVFTAVHPEDAGALRAKYARLVRGEMSAFAQQFRVLHRDGTYRWHEASYVAALEGRPMDGVVVISRDITARKYAEQRLAQREKRFRLAADAVDGVVFEWDLTAGIVHRSRGLNALLGIEPADLAAVPDAWLERIHPQDHADLHRTIRAALSSAGGWTTSYRIRDARGRYRSMLERVVIQRDEGGDPVRAIGSAVDVSEVARLNALLVETQRAARMGGWEYLYATGEMTGTEELCRIYGADSQRFAVSWETLSARCTEESRRRLTEARTAAQTTAGSFDLELEIDTLAGRRIWIRFIGHWETLDGRPHRAYGSVQDINAQKLDRIALENTSGWLKLSMNMAHMHAWRWNIADDSLEFAVVDGMVHLPTVLPGMKKFMLRVHPRDRPGLSAAIEQAFATRTELQHQFRVKSPEGRYLTYHTVARPLFDAANQRQGLVGVTRDVTERYEAEARLKRSEELLRATTANTADTLLLIDSALQVRFINRAVGERSIEDIRGRRVSTLLPEAARNGVIDKLRKVLRTGKAATNEFQVAAQEKTQYYEYRAVRMSADGMGAGLSIAVRNVTERKRLEQEILAVSSRERHTIGRDLHDGLGQELTGIALMLRGLATRIQARCPDVVENVNEIVALVNQSIESARSLARGLLPVRTDNGGIAFALSTLAARSRDVYGLDVTFRCESCEEIEVSEASASHLYRIAQEALTNASRHGGADRVDIFLSVAKTQFTLRISDNGCGIDDSAKASAGMGLKIMKYRAHMIGAKFTITQLAPHGTVVSITGEQPVVTSALQSLNAI